MEVLLVERKGMMVHTRLAAFLITCLLVSGLCGVVPSAAALKTFQALPSAQQFPAPAFTLPDHRGTSVSLADMRGKVVVVRFWVTW
jgi:cytochrome oxidase Cu insertion factor (SCO1/SenC/PrrC family)